MAALAALAATASVGSCAGTRPLGGDQFRSRSADRFRPSARDRRDRLARLGRALEDLVFVRMLHLLFRRQQPVGEDRLVARHDVIAVLGGEARLLRLILAWALMPSLARVPVMDQMQVVVEIE